MLKNVYEGLNAQKCIWRLKCSTQSVFIERVFLRNVSRLGCLLSFASLFHSFLLHILHTFFIFGSFGTKYAFSKKIIFFILFLTPNLSCDYTPNRFFAIFANIFPKNLANRLLFKYFDVYTSSFKIWHFKNRWRIYFPKLTASNLVFTTSS